ncbi:MAG TPA: TetR family transcriptional regulator [Baekduia sp.]|nr:TetR family transcriptional regulator [Baekduia sp.]
MSTDGPLTAEQILEAAEEALRRFGPGKATVVDVARALGVSHGSVYRHFPSKAALRGAVTARWLARISGSLEVVADTETPAPERLHRWLRQLIDAKRSRAAEDPELFETYMILVVESADVTAAHVDELAAQLGRIVADGVARGELVSDDPAATGRAILDATGRFHNPTHRAEWGDPRIDEQFEAVWTLLLRGLTKGLKKAAKAAAAKS